jgi:hypothetical protein
MKKVRLGTLNRAIIGVTGMFGAVVFLALVAWSW